MVVTNKYYNKGEESVVEENSFYILQSAISTTVLRHILRIICIPSH